MKKLLTTISIVMLFNCHAQFLRAQGLSAKQTAQVNQMITTAIAPLKTDIASLKVSVANLQTQTASFVSQITTLQTATVNQGNAINDLKIQVNVLTLKTISQQKTIDSLVTVMKRGISVQGGGKVVSDTTLIIQAVYDTNCKCFKPAY